MVDYSVFKVGDKVSCCYGDGIIHIVEQDSYVSVHIDGVEAFFDIQKNHKYPAIWFTETGTPPTIGDRPKWVPTEPTWCKVWDDGIIEVAEENLVVGYHEGVEYPYYDADGHCWEYAEPCDPPEWANLWRKLI